MKAIQHTTAEYPVVYTLIQQPNGCAAWRVCWPAYLLASRGYPVGLGYNGVDQDAGSIAAADLVVLHRSCWSPGDEWRAYLFQSMLHDDGKTLGYETDDDLYSEDVVERIRKTGDEELNARSDEQLERERQARIFALQLADGVTVSTPTLADVVRRFTDKPIHVVPNAIDLARFMTAIAAYGWRPKSHPLTIGWAGGNRPDTDAEKLAVAWGRLAKRYPDLQFVVGGYPLQCLLNAVPADQVMFIDKQPLSQYPATFSQIDIGCCPLADETFNRSKSPIKAMEYAAAGAAVVASPTVYREFFGDHRDGYICESADDWEAALTTLVENLDVRADLADRLFARVQRDHTLGLNANRWPTAWAQIVEASLHPSTTGARA